MKETNILKKELNKTRTEEELKNGRNSHQGIDSNNKKLNNK